ncbi:unnamed protein product, partial [Ectocarpus fasciculatus]
VYHRWPPHPGCLVAIFERCRQSRCGSRQLGGRTGALPRESSLPLREGKLGTFLMESTTVGHRIP